MIADRGPDPRRLDEELQADVILERLVIDGGLIAVIGAQAIATTIAVTGILVTALPWYWALIVWGYAIAWFVVTDRLKLLAYRILDPARQT